MKKVVLHATGFLLGCVLGWNANNWLRIDKCLDGGGKWNYEQDSCQKSNGKKARIAYMTIGALGALLYAKLWVDALSDSAALK